MPSYANFYLIFIYLFEQIPNFLKKIALCKLININMIYIYFSK